MIIVRLPSGLRGGPAHPGDSASPGGRGGSSGSARGLFSAGGASGSSGAEVRVDEPVETLGELVAALERLRPDLRDALHDSLYNFAVNDTLVLHGADAHPLTDGDIVELIPTIAGG